MSRPSQPMGPNMTPPFKRQPRSSWSRKSVSTADPASSRVPIRWSSGPQQREASASRTTVSRQSTADSDMPKLRQSILRTNGRRDTLTSDDCQTDLEIDEEICAALKSPTPGDGRRTARGMRICVEEMSSSVGSMNFSPPNSPLMPPRDLPARRSSRSVQAEPRRRASTDVRQYPLKTTGIAAPRNEKRKEGFGLVGSWVEFPCPFRKRNPGRFNIRDHDACARARFHAIVDIKYVSRRGSSCTG